MPNLCSNTTTIYGAKEDVAAFRSALDHEEGMAKTFHPIPKALAETTAGYYLPEPHPNWKVMLDVGEMTQEWYDELVRTNAEGYAKNQENIATYGHKDWYDWAKANWGTKWGDYDLQITEGETILTISYTTAWCPMDEAIRYISGLFPALKFVTTYDEPGMCFCGAYAAWRGEIVSQVYVEGEEYPAYDCEDDDAYEGFLDEINETLAAASDKVTAELISYAKDQIGVAN